MPRGRFRQINPNGISKDRPYEVFQSTKERESYILPSGYTVRQSFAALYRLWKQFKAYRHDFNVDGQRVTAAKIQDIQREMGIAVGIFPDLGLYSTDDELPITEEHSWEEVVALHDMIEERKQAEEEEVLEDAYSKRKGCEYWRQ